MQQSQWRGEDSAECPLVAVSPEKRLMADYAVSSVTTGPHPDVVSAEGVTPQRLSAGR